MAEESGLRDRVTRDRLLLAVVLLVGIAGTGIVRRQLGLLGYNGLGRLVFILGYGGTVFVVWYGWIRPIDITGPSADRDLTRDDLTRGDADSGEEADRPDTPDR
ncbi:hypothetical protein Hbl1158_07035 [Halobaculum sp. CBA1158]|uniref:hypothetical protein n=1 Tax=Halobaculum sp. CBA1158 TaxID=2904243 RepID=UPI001F1BB37A|nr:hypothetical protein [Halobaculum sp. CBA1158]UIP01096.1 hypothetical protein Hbl1158_07035 [Halobaculum sp. CBA1158]